MPNVDYGLSAMHRRTASASEVSGQEAAKPTRSALRVADERLATFPGKPLDLATMPGWHLRSRTSQALINNELETHQGHVWNLAACGLLVVDTHGAVLSLNETARQWLNAPATPSGPISFSNYIAAEDAPGLSQFLNDVFSARPTGSIDLHVKYSANAESSRCLRLSVVSIASLTAALSLTDVTELKEMEAKCQRAEDRLQQLQRLELVHTMSAGIMHDFKNIVHVIESYAAVLMGQTSSAGEEHSMAAQIMLAASRGAMLANRWLMFSRYGELQTQSVEVNDYVRSSLESIKPGLPSSIEVEIHASEQPIHCKLDPCLIEQVLFNLCSNARDAMPGGGRLKLGIERVEFDSQASSDDLLPPGAYAKISVTDDGIGIAAEYLDRIFEPFFTTKSSHTGTGLGLSLVRCIISEHQGAIEVWSEVGKGSTFVIYLPGLNVTANQTKA